MTSTVSRLAVPSFDLTTLTLHENVPDMLSLKGESHIFALIPGGGGNMKNGLKNQIVSEHFIITVLFFVSFCYLNCCYT